MVHKLEAVDTQSIYVIRPRWYTPLKSPVTGMIIYRSEQTIVELDESGRSYEVPQELHLSFLEAMEYLFNLWIQSPTENTPLDVSGSIDVLMSYTIFKNNLVESLERYGIKFFDVESIACGATYIALKLNSRSYRCQSQC